MNAKFMHDLQTLITQYVQDLDVGYDLVAYGLTEEQVKKVLEDLVTYALHK